ncbi:MAG: LytR C-terminal domain-containing protein [bacterium]
MAKRRRKLRQDTWRGAKPKPRTSRRRTKDKSLKERSLTAGIWAMGLINLVLIASHFSNYFISSEDKPTSINNSETPQKVETISAEVLNACGVQGLANEFTQYLRDNHIDVVYVGNSPGGFNLDRTIIFDRMFFDCRNASTVGKLLGVEKKNIIPQMDNSSQLMVTILIGKDYKNLKVYDFIHRSN